VEGRVAIQYVNALNPKVKKPPKITYIAKMFYPRMGYRGEGDFFFGLAIDRANNFVQRSYCL
jgi:hypothetical protein